LNYALLEQQIKQDGNAAFNTLVPALNDAPDDPRLVAGMAAYFHNKGAYGLGYHLWRRFLEMDKRPNPGALNNVGLCAAATGTEAMQAEAEKYFRMSLKLDPKGTPALNNLALHHLHNGDHEQALKLCERSLETNPDQPEVHECMAYCLLMMGQWERGWKEWHYSVGTKYRPILGDGPEWDGERGGDLMVRGEQGLGDEISFASILPDAAKDNRVTLECDSRLAGLFRRSFPYIDVHGTRNGEKRGQFKGYDYRTLIGSLGRVYRTTPESFPGTAYLVADPERRLQWRALLDTFAGKKIGIAWTGGRTNTFAERRSFRLEDWAPILGTDHTFISLQYQSPDPPELAKFGVKHWPRATETQDYDDTAALVAELDLVITATTAVVHLCGALGKECWVLAPRRPRWFYGREGRRIPWYKSVEIFRQTKDGWPIDEIAQRLKAWE
jgi:Tfp pilus assembly protein PilF